MTGVELGRLYVVREQIDALIEAAEAQLAPAPVCSHPEESRKYTNGTMGGATRFTCQQCGVTVVSSEEMSAIVSRVTTPEGA